MLIMLLYDVFLKVDRLTAFDFAYSFLQIIRILLFFFETSKMSNASYFELFEPEMK